MPETPKSQQAARGGGLRKLGREAPVAFRKVLRNPKKLTRALALAGAVLLLALFWRQLDLAELHSQARRMPGYAVLAVMSLLPLLGFPVSWLHLVAGVRFGFWGGMTSVAVTGFLQHFFGLVMARLLPPRLLGFASSWKRRFAGASHADAVVLCAVLPGMPYTVQLYLLPLLGTPLPLLLLLSPLLHTLRALVTILLGDYSDELTSSRILLLSLYYALLISLSAIAVRRLQRRWGTAGPAADEA